MNEKKSITYKFSWSQNKIYEKRIIKR